MAAYLVALMVAHLELRKADPTVAWMAGQMVEPMVACLVEKMVVTRAPHLVAY